MCPLAHHTAHTLLRTSVLILCDKLQFGGAHGAILEVAHAGNTPVDK